MIYFYSQSLSSFFLKEYLKVVSSNEYEDQIQQIQVDNSEFMFAFKIEQNNFTASPYFNLTLEQKQYRRNQNGQQTKSSFNLPLIPCTIDRFQSIFSKYQNDFEEQFKILGINDFLCPQQNYIQLIDKTQPYLWEEHTQAASFNFLHCKLQNVKIMKKWIVHHKKKQMNIQKQWDHLKFQSILLTKQQIHINNNIDLSFQMIKFILHSFLIKQIDKPTFTLGNMSLQMIKVQCLLVTSNKILFFKLIKLILKKCRILVHQAIQYLQHLIFNLIHLKQNLQEIIKKLMSCFQIQVEFNKHFSFLLAQPQVFTTESNVNEKTIIVLIELANKIFEFQIDSTLLNRQHQENLELIDEFMQHRENHIHANSDENINEQDNQQMEEKLSPNISQRYNLLNLFVNTGGTYTKNTTKSKSTREAYRQQYRMAEKLKQMTGLDYFQKQIINIIERQKPIYLDFIIFCNYISCGKLFKNNPRVILMNKAFENILDQLDVHHILLKLNELDKLKETVFNYKQLLMFNFTPKPQINLENNTAQPSRQLIEQIVKSPGITEKEDSLQLVNQKQWSRNYFSLLGDHLIYSKIFNAYDDILQSTDTVYTNKALIQKLGPELQIVFKLSKLIDIQHKIYNRQRNPTRRGAMQEDEEDLCVKMFDQQSQ
ncbi:unnamed protein product (macronuclear) [Paramecium tetraurelia]|uniref:Uncharacterized protein n=1 Tax=Paramecium tetraurelia TaxID=5888 RepID=A0D7U6_PARTE|nr:uncharacterized protein GSPATT00014080001 [Paramecium tetraurelia]CAK79113.1 unnamed protein product [Paramecium tetraurelia]|eukprot:XP_001446510.1 hypothetical protein (macronuclear) [Paramecium tetraurelia strain d4-2]